MVFEEDADGGSLRGVVRLRRVGRLLVKMREVEGLKQGSTCLKGEKGKRLHT